MNATTKTDTERVHPAAADRAALLPRLPGSGDRATPEMLHEMRRWFVGADTGTPQPGTALPGTALLGAALPAAALPPLLLPFRDPSRVRNDYPLVVQTGHDGAVTSLGTYLQRLAQNATQQRRIIEDNLLRWERQVRSHVGVQRTTDALTTLHMAGQRMLGELTLPATAAAGVASDFDAILTSEAQIELLPLGTRTPLRLLATVAERRMAQTRERMVRRVHAAAEQLRARLQIEAAKDSTAHGATGLAKSLGTGAGRFIDTEKLARAVGDHRGTQRTGPARRKRLQEALDSFSRWLDRPPPPAMLVVHDPSEELSLAEVGDDVELHATDAIFRAAAERFDNGTADLLELVRALRLAELEARDAYDPARHDALLQGITWTECSPDELHLVPVIVVLADAFTIVDRDIAALTSLLTSGRPVHVLAGLSPVEDPAHENDPLPRSRLELGYLGIAFREVFVQQSTAARPTHLLDGFEKALRSTRPGLHVVDSGLDGLGNEPPLGAFLFAGAAIEGRAHLLFHYDPDHGETFARRLDFAHNPSLEVDWPSSPLQVASEDGSVQSWDLEFTFADFALIEPRLHAAFALVPHDATSDALVPLAEWLRLDGDAAAHALPFVWIATGDRPAVLHRAIVRRSLVEVCRDRLRFLHTLQELAGIRNEHVREAVQRARNEAQAEAQRERDALQARHAKELLAVRAQTASETMQGLARMLLGLDLEQDLAAAPAQLAAPKEALAEAPPTAETAAETSAEVTAEPAADSAAADDDDEIVEEPWIDSARCSTCNDCINLNPLLFAYDENKQAFVKDPHAGTYAQLVQAAEKCPSRCIHPGMPLDPDEDGLAELVERARPFNG